MQSPVLGPQPSVGQVRRNARAARRSLSPREQHLHSKGLVQHLHSSGVLLRSHHIAAYLATDGELDPSLLFPLLFRRGKRLFLPVLRSRPQGKLWFAEHHPGGPLRRNRFAILEPPLGSRDRRTPHRLDVLLLPLVAFDSACNRLGMGGGFYDRTLAYLRHARAWRRPQLIGVAHECQRVEALPVRPWDVSLDLVVTERHLYRSRSPGDRGHSGPPSSGGPSE